MIAKDKPKIDLLSDKNNKKQSGEKIDLQFEKMIKNVMEEQGYFKEKDVKKLIDTILNNLEPMIAKHVKKHFYEIGKYVTDNINNKPNLEDKNGEEKDAKTS